MAGHFKNILGIIIFLVITTYSQSCINHESGISNYEELRNNIIVVDSLKLNNNDSLFWYCIDLGIQGYSDGKVGIAKNRNELEVNAKLVVVSNEITSIKILSNDTLQISFFSDHKFSGIVQRSDYFKFIKVNKAGGYNDLIIYRIEH
jgi:hypothetical protein